MSIIGRRLKQLDSHYAEWSGLLLSQTELHKRLTFMLVARRIAGYHNEQIHLSSALCHIREFTINIIHVSCCGVIMVMPATVSELVCTPQTTNCDNCPEWARNGVHKKPGLPYKAIGLIVTSEWLSIHVCFLSCIVYFFEEIVMEISPLTDEETSSRLASTCCLCSIPWAICLTPSYCGPAKCVSRVALKRPCGLVRNTSRGNLAGPRCR